MNITLSPRVVQQIKKHYLDFTGNDLDDLSQDQATCMVEMLFEEVVNQTTQEDINLFDEYADEDLLDF